MLLAMIASGLAAALLAPSTLRRSPGSAARASAVPGAVPGALPGAVPGAVPAWSGASGPPLRVLVTMGAALGVGAFLGGSLGVLVAMPAAGAAWWATGRMEAPAVRRRREQLTASVPHVVDLMAACLAAGLSPSAAVQQIAAAVEPPVQEELSDLAARLRLGMDPVSVWRELARHPQLGGLGRSVSRAVESGASVADAMQRLAEDLRSRARADVESRARTVGVKAAIPLGVCLLPAFVLVGVVPLVAGSVSVLLHS